MKRSSVWLLGCALLQFALAMPLVIGQAPAGKAAAGKKYALLVGVNDYDHVQFSRLKWAVNDAVELGEVLQKQGFAVTVLHSGAKQPGLTPTLANINARLGETLDKCKRDDTVVVALAGHGLQFEKAKAGEQEDAYFCPQDARFAAERRDTLLSMRQLYRQLGESGAGVKLLMVDACRKVTKLPSGAKRSGVDGATTLVPPRGVAALFSCSADEYAMEHSELKHGVFFHVLLEGLRGKAAVDGEVSWDSLQLYVRKRVTRDVAALVGDPDARQTPALNCIELAGEPPVLAVVGAAKIAAVKTKGTKPEGMKDPAEPRAKLDVPVVGKELVKPAKSDEPTSYLKIVSPAGDFIGQGKTYEYKGSDLVVKKTARGVHVEVKGWGLDIGGPNGQFLAVGEHRDAKRFFVSGKSPGLDFSGNGRGSNTLSGEFAVWELEVAGGQFTRLAIDFVQRCEGKGPPLIGNLRINSTFE